jgi:uncharacterized damage-inducible protein DinB
MERSLDDTVLHTLRLRLSRDYPGQIAACLDALREDQIWWRPNDQANAIGNLVIHLAWSNRYYLEQVIGGRDIGRNRDAEFAARGGLTKDDVRARWDDAVRLVTGTLEQFTPERLLETTDRTGKTSTVLQILLHVSHHNAIHTGQILWVTKMLQPGAIDDIGIKLRAR